MSAGREEAGHAMTNVNVKKGDRIEARWFGDGKPVALAGMQMKVQATEMAVTGTIRHFRGDHPTAPTVVRLYVDPEQPWSGPTVRPHGCRCDHEHVEVDPQHVSRVL